MMSRILAILGIFFIGFATVFSQPQICTDAEMVSFCNQACIICDIDGFTGRNNSTATGQVPPGFCTTFAHNLKWIAFLAGSTNLELHVTVRNCTINEGLEIGIYESPDCENFQLVSNCDTEVLPNTTAIFITNVPLVIGNHYYFVMDGSSGDVCDYTVEVVNGSTAVDVLPSTNPIQGPDNLCLDTPYTFSTPALTTAIKYVWSINGTQIGLGATTDLTFDQPGVYTLTATASNACNTATPATKIITVYPEIPPTILNIELCDGDCVEVGGTSLCTDGSYDFALTSRFGCDSMVTANIVVFENPSIDLGNIIICEGDSLFLGGSPFFTAGSYQKVIPTAQNCDSTISFSLQTIVCNITASQSSQPALCFNQSSGQITFSVLTGTPPFTYEYRLLNVPTLTGNGNIAQLNQPTTIAQLLPGSYTITIMDTFGNSRIVLATVGNPTRLLPFGNIISQFGAFNVSCYNESDGAILANAMGGTPPYRFQWDNGPATALYNQIEAGTYQVDIFDANNCITRDTFTLLSPDSITMEVDFQDLSCDGFTSGGIRITDFQGAIAPVQYRINNGVWQDTPSFENLEKGIYSVELRDAKGCIHEVVDTLISPIIPIISLGEDKTIILGESLVLNSISNTELFLWQWSPSVGLSCTDCPKPSVTGINDITYYFQAASIDDCFAVDSVNIKVLKIRDVYVPTVFSPNGDELNDLFIIFGGVEVTKIESFKVFSRWGNLIYDGVELAPNVATEKWWDGTFNGEKLDNGTFTWMATVRFIDDEIIRYQGAVSLIK